MKALAFKSLLACDCVGSPNSGLSSLGTRIVPRAPQIDNEIGRHPKQLAGAAVYEEDENKRKRIRGGSLQSKSLDGRKHIHDATIA